MQQNKAQNTFSFSIAGLESKLTFRATAEPLNPERIESFVLPESLQLMIFADEEFNIGSAWYCQAVDSGRIYRVDPEHGKCAEFVNSDIEVFKTFLQEAAKWSSEFDTENIVTNPGLVDVLKDTLMEIDSAAFESNDLHWPGLLEYMKSCAKEIDDVVSEIESGLEFKFQFT